MDDLRKRMRFRIPQAKSWYQIKAQDGRAVVRIYDEISLWGVTAEDFAADIAGLDVSDLEVQINSPGGDVFDGVAIYNALRTHDASVTTRVDGLAASAASVIVQAGDRRVMVSGSQMMVHEAWGIAIGPASEMREFADLLDKQSDNLAAIYAARSGRPVDEIRGEMAEETWLTADEAVESGYADDVFEPAAKASLLDEVFAKFRQESPGEREETEVLTRVRTLIDGNGKA